ncbi:MAG: hypothetical protein WC612_04290 [Bdellovibrionales bacterium]
MGKNKKVSPKAIAKLKEQGEILGAFVDNAHALLSKVAKTKDFAALKKIIPILSQAIRASGQMGAFKELPSALNQRGFIHESLALDNAYISTLPRDSALWSGIVLRYATGAVNLLPKGESPLPYLFSIAPYLRRSALLSQTKPLVAQCFLQAARQATENGRVCMEEVAHRLYRGDTKRQNRMARRLACDTIKFAADNSVAYKAYHVSLSSVVNERKKLRDAMKTKEQLGLVCSGREKRRENLLLDIQKKAGEDLMRRMAKDPAVHTEHHSVLIADDVSRDIPILRKRFNQMMNKIQQYDVQDLDWG